jgi:hypothetical protein
MREIYKNPMFYYLLIPVLVGLWPVLVWGVYLPRVERDQEVEQGLLIEGQTQIVDILRLDQGRLNFADANDVAGEFSYPSAVDRVANLCRIPASNCTYQAGSIITSAGKRRQDARIKLTDVSIVQTAEFLYTIQARWVHLTCEKVKLTKKKGMPDQWEVDLDMVYYY